MCDSFRFRAGRTYELPCSTYDPPSLPRLRSKASARAFRFTIREKFPPLQKSGAPLLVHPPRELVPAVPDMFVTPSWLTAATSACSLFEQRAACDPATSRHPRQALPRAHARIFFTRLTLATDTPVPVTAPGAVTVTRQGPLEESPVSIQAPRNARSLSYG